MKKLKKKTGVAFGNIKTHKAGNPLRLITSCCGKAIENLSDFTEFYSQPLARKLPSLIKDTTDLLNKLEDVNKSGPFPAGTLLVSCDVVSMFPNIDNKLGLTAVRKALNARENKFPSTTCILEVGFPFLGSRRVWITPFRACTFRCVGILSDFCI